MLRNASPPSVVVIGSSSSRRDDVILRRLTGVKSHTVCHLEGAVIVSIFLYIEIVITLKMSSMLKVDSELKAKVERPGRRSHHHSVSLMC